MRIIHDGRAQFGYVITQQPSYNCREEYLGALKNYCYTKINFEREVHEKTLDIRTRELFWE